MTPVLVQSRLSSLRVVEESFIPHALHPSINYLRQARQPRGAWPALPGLAASLHCSALAIAALHLVDREAFKIEIAESAAHLRKSTAGFGPVGPQDLLAQIAVAEVEGMNIDYRRELLRTLDQSLSAAAAERHGAPTQILSQAVLAAGSAGMEALRRKWCDLLLQRQHRDPGSWPELSDIESHSMSATAWATRALTGQPEERYSKAGLHGAEHLLREIRLSGWGPIADRGTYQLVTVVRTLCALPQTPNPVQEEGLSRLLSHVNADGGWGAHFGQASGVEYTALAIAGLFESGVGRYVPYREARKMVTEIAHETEDAITERDDLRHSLDIRVTQTCEQIMIDRNRLRDELATAEDQISQLETAIRNLPREGVPIPATLYIDQTLGLRRSTLSRVAMRFNGNLARAWRWLVGPLAVSGVSGAGLLIFLTFRSPGASENVWLGAVFGAAMALAYIAVRVRLKRPAAVAAGVENGGMPEPHHSRSTLTRLLELFRVATQDLSAEIREELVYHLLRDGVDQQPDQVDAYVARLLLRLRIPPRGSPLLKVWLDAWFAQPANVRQTTLAHLRRSLL